MYLFPKASSMPDAGDPFLATNQEAWRHKLFHTFYFLQSDKIFPVCWILIGHFEFNWGAPAAARPRQPRLEGLKFLQFLHVKTKPKAKPGWNFHSNNHVCLVFLFSVCLHTITSFSSHSVILDFEGFFFVDILAWDWLEANHKPLSSVYF